MLSYKTVYQICFGTNSSLLCINYNSEMKDVFLLTHFKVKLEY